MLLKPTLPRYAVPDIVRVSVFQKHKGHLLPAIIRRPLENIHKKPSEESCRMIGHSSPTLTEEMTDLIAGTAPAPEDVGQDYQPAVSHAYERQQRRSGRLGRAGC